MKRETICCFLVLAMLLGGSLLVIPAEATVKILPLGDSITRGGAAVDSPYPSYRYLLWNYLKTGGYDVDFIGSTTYPTFSSFSFDQDHEGHRGYTTGMELNGDPSDDPEGKLSTWLNQYTPDIVLLHIGTNDVLQQVNLSERLSNVDQIINTLRAANPDVKILLAQIIPTSDAFRNSNSELIAFDHALPALAAGKNTTQSPVIVVDMYTGYDGFADNQYDGIHPQTSGEKKLADRWYAALAPLLNNSTVTPEPTPAPWDAPQQVPGSIQACDYAPGGEGVAYHDTTAGNAGGAYRQDDVDIEYSSAEQQFVVRDIRSGEWLTYEVNVASGGIYTIDFRVASPDPGAAIDLEVDGSEVMTVQVPDTGSSGLYTTVRRPAYLPGGNHTLTLAFSGSFNLNSLKFAAGLPDGKNTTQSPVIVVDMYTGYDGFADNQYDGIHPQTSGEKKLADRWYAALAPLLNNSTVTPEPTPAPWDAPQQVPGSIQACDYAPGGEGVAYHDTTAGNAGGAYRQDDVDIEYSSAEQQFVVRDIRSGEWLTYEVNVASGGIYTIDFRVASPDPGAAIDLEVDGSEVMTVQVPDTGSSGLYTTVRRPAYLPGGNHTLTLAFSGSFNLNYLKFAAGLPDPIGTPTPVPTGTTVSPTDSPTLPATTATTTPTTTSPTTAPTPLPLPSSVDAPRDLNGDGLYEDVNGNGSLDFNDVVLFFNQLDWIAENEPVSAFDFNKNGQIDFNDIVILFNEL
ncbi:carbohydrate-binding protein [Methanosphaerula subterraneus]|uniref:carbohydrate-binding protein n=1 Tax=Methanosphaerula subterraneus TaxID=3350244 RepID=UPI003F850282